MKKKKPADYEVKQLFELKDAETYCSRWISHMQTGKFVCFLN